MVLQVKSLVLQLHFSTPFFKHAVSGLPLIVFSFLQLGLQLCFLFSSQECFDSKPRIISKRSKENLAVCSNLTARHPFDDNKSVSGASASLITQCDCDGGCVISCGVGETLSLMADQPPPSSSSGAWCTWCGRPTCATARCGRCTRSASSTCVATRFATAASARTAAPSPTPSSSSSAGSCSRTQVGGGQLVEGLRGGNNPVVSLELT